MKLKFLGIMLLCCFTAFAQTYEWDNTMFFSAGDQLAIMDNNHKIITGRFEGSMAYQGITLSTSLYYGVFIAKLDENDSLLWIRKFAESPYSSQLIPIKNLEVDKQNNIYLTLDFRDSIFVDGQVYIANTIVNGYKQSLLLKFDANGNIIQDFYFDGSCLKGIRGVQIDNQQNVYIYGAYGNDNFWTTASCSCIFDGTSHTTTSTDIFLAKYDSLGSLLWLNTFEANHNINPIGFNISGNSIYLSGTVYNSNIAIDFGSFILTYPINYDKGGFMAEYDTDGTFKWAKYYGAKGWDSNVYPYDIAILNSNTIVVGGQVHTQSESAHLYFQNAAPLYGLSSSGAETNYFVIAYDSLGNIKWKDLAECSGWDGVYAMSSDSKSNLYVTGYYNNSLHFGNTSLPNAGDDLFVAAFDSNGINLWAKKAGENGGTYALDIEVDSEDNIYVNGYTYSNPIVFGDTSYTINTSPSVFIAKMAPTLVSSTTNIQAVNPNKKLLKIVDVLVRETKVAMGSLLFFIYSDGTVEKKVFVE
jgi:hypothetical protein